MKNFVEDANLEKRLDELRRQNILFRELPPSEQLVRDFNNLIYGEQGRHK